MAGAPAAPASPYRPLLNTAETLKAVRFTRDTFEQQLCGALNLRPVVAPLFVPARLGINDDLTGTERPVSFKAPALGQERIEVLQSLAKWKRLALADLNVAPGEGICAGLHAIRPDEKLDEIHSLYVDQWDWERVLHPGERTLPFLQWLVERIYGAVQTTAEALARHWPVLKPDLPDRVTFIHARQLADRWPDQTPRQREEAISRQVGAVFIIGVGAPLADGHPHDSRAPDYDDWITPNGVGRGLNGDLILRHPVIDRAVELSSMGIRVDAEALREQLRLCGATDRAGLYFHRRLLEGSLPPSTGGGIGQSRLCMLLLRKAHIGEVQPSTWPEPIRRACARRGIPLL